MNKLVAESPFQAIEIGNVIVDIQKRMVFINKESAALSTREFELFLFLCNHLEWAISKEQLYQAVWNEIAFESHHAVENAVYRIRKVLTAMDSNAVIETVIGYGYRLTLSKHSFGK